MTLDIGSDWTVIDNLISVTYYPKTSETGPFAPVTIPHVLQRVTEKKLTEGKHNLNIGKATFHVWTDQTNVVPKANDKLTDADGVGWVVKEVNLEALNTRFKLTCRVAQ